MLQLPIGIQLEGLGATSEQSVDLTQYPAMQRHRKSIPLDNMQVCCHTAPLQAPGLTMYMPDSAVKCAVRATFELALLLV
jgi:hypothetical protein